MKDWQKFLIAVAAVSVIYWLENDYQTVVGGIFRSIWYLITGYGIWYALSLFEQLGTYLADRRFMKINGQNMIKVDGKRFTSVTDAKIYIRVKYEGWNDDRIK